MRWAPLLGPWGLLLRRQPRWGVVGRCGAVCGGGGADATGATGAVWFVCVRAASGALLTATAEGSALADAMTVVADGDGVAKAASAGGCGVDEANDDILPKKKLSQEKKP